MGFFWGKYFFLPKNNAFYIKLVKWLISNLLMFLVRIAQDCDAFCCTGATPKFTVCVRHSSICPFIHLKKSPKNTFLQQKNASSVCLTSVCYALWRHASILNGISDSDEWCPYHISWNHKETGGKQFFFGKSSTNPNKQFWKTQVFSKS